MFFVISLGKGVGGVEGNLTACGEVFKDEVITKVKVTNHRMNTAVSVGREVGVSSAGCGLSCGCPSEQVNM